MFEEAKGKGVLKLSRGKVQAIIQEKIAKRIATFGEANRFEIHTPTAIAGARGCNFIVSFQRNSSSVLVLEGTVLTYNPKFPDMAVTVTTGYITTIPLDQPAQPARPFTDAEKKMHEGDFAPGGSGEKSEAENTVISEATTGPAEPGAPSGPESLTPMGTLTEIVQPPPITETAGTDTTPPVINIIGPPDLSNLPVSTFNVTSDETVIFIYQMESWGAVSPDTTSDNFNLEGLPDGTYTLTVTATDQAGNSSTASYTWTVDQTPPTVITEPPSPTNLSTASFGFNEPVTYTYSLDGGTSTSGTGSAIPLSGLTEDEHTITITATDQAENTSTESFTWTTDYTAPSVTLSGGPLDFTNQATADFSVSSSEQPVTYTYTLDGSPASSTSLSGLSEGPHTFSAIATDQAENTSIESYTWTTDYTDPSISLTPVATSPEEGTTATVSIDLENTEAVTYSYRLDGGEWKDLDLPFNILNVPEGSNLLEVQATDLATNQSPVEQLSFDLSRYSLTGNFYGCIAGVYGEASGEIAGVSNEDWGGWNISMSGSGGNPADDWTLWAGGKSSDNIESNNNGYWLLIADGITSGDSLSGASTLKYLSQDRLGFGEGDLTGSYVEIGPYNFEYTLQDVGSGSYTERPLAFGGSLSYGKFISYDPESGYVSDGDSYIEGLIGGTTSLWDGSLPSTFMGKYSNPNQRALWDSDISGRTSDGGAFYISGGGIAINDSAEGIAVGLYIKPDGAGGYVAGYLTLSPFDVNTYPEISMWETSPVIIASVGIPTTISPEQLYWGSPYLKVGWHEGFIDGSITGSIDLESLRLIDQNEGRWMAWLGGNYTNTPSAEWEAVTGGTDYGGETEINGYWLNYMIGTDWSGNKLTGTLSGKHLNLDSMGTLSGDILGTYTEEGSGTWQAISLGTYTVLPLAFGGSTSGNFMYWNGEGMSDSGLMQGLMGGTESLWSGSPSFLSLGTYEGQNGNTLWSMDIGTEGTSGWTLDDGNSGAFLGTMGGIALSDNLEGMAIGIYIKPTDTPGQYEAGYISSNNIIGSLYPGLGMYELGGNLTAVSMGTTTLSPSNLYWDSPYLEVDETYFAIVGDISGEGIGQGIIIEDPDGYWGWNIWRAGCGGTYESEPTEPWDAVSGFVRYDEYENIDGYNISHITGETWSDGKFIASVSGKQIGRDDIGDITGSMLGTYNDGTWQALGVGITTDIPLAFGGILNSGSFQWDQTFWLVVDGGLTGLMGVAEIDGSPSFLSLGTYETDNETNNFYNGALWGVDIVDSTPDNGALLGITGGVVLGNNLEGGLLAIYIKPDGEGYETGYILSDNINGSLYPGLGMYELGGNLISISMGATSILPDNLNWDSIYGDSPSLHLVKGYGTIEGDLTGEIGSQNINLTDQNWGIWYGSSVSYNSEENPSIPSSWTAYAVGETYGIVYSEDGPYWDLVGYWGSQITGNRIDTDNKLVGTSIGYFADISATPPITGISVGETLGTFDPNVYTWQAIQMGAWLETNKFLEMAATTEGQAKLQQMNIPCVEVGRATLTGSGNNFTNLNMTDTIFFAPNSGAKPTIWATGNVGGTYTAPPTLDSPIGLSSGSGLNAAFTFKTWDSGSGKWLSTVNGTGGFNGSTSFQGAGAGTGATSGSGTIKEGTAAGVAK
jgi:hypothetical protein